MKQSSDIFSQTTLMGVAVLFIFSSTAFFFWYQSIGTNSNVTFARTPATALDTIASTTILDTSVSAIAIMATSSATHVATPSSVHAIYMSQCVVGTPSFRDSLVKFIDDTSLNAVVIDIKDFSGGISFPTDNEVLKGSVSAKCGAHDMKIFIEELHKKNIYVIGRITTFQDPTYAKAHPAQAVQSKKGGMWHNFGGLAFVDVGAKPFWDYIATLAKVSYQDEGFDELNFDYIRFPSDGPMSDAVYSLDVGKPKPQALEEFFSYLHGQLHPLGIPMSADLFGMTSTNYDDLNIGQVLERALPYFDFIDPMVYPSHYPTGFNNFKNVNEHSYAIVHQAMEVAARRASATSTTIASIEYTKITVSTSTSVGTTTKKKKDAVMYAKPSYDIAKIRPWLQSFDYPVTYTPAMVTEQIKATEDAGLTSWIFWDAGNKYRSLRAVLKTE